MEEGGAAHASERKNRDGVENTGVIDRDGEFNLEEAHKVEIAAETEG